MAEDSELLMYAAGDIGIQRSDPEEAFAKIAPVLRQADVVFGNLESVVSNRLVRHPWKQDCLGCRPDVLPAIKSAGFNVMTMANNHIMDYGWDSLSRCIELLDEVGIAHTGAGANIFEARKPVIIERKGTRIAFLAYCSFFTVAMPLTAASNTSPGAVPIYTDPYYDPPHVYTGHLEDMRNDIAMAREDADLVIVSCHWGVAFAHTVVAYQKAIGRAAIDAGADLVLGHHPHILQGIEVYKGKAICYSLCELGFELPISVGQESQTILLKVEIEDRAIRKVSFLPVLMDPRRVSEIRGLKDPEGLKIATLMSRLSGDLGTELAFEDDSVVVTGTSA